MEAAWGPLGGMLIAGITGGVTIVKILERWLPRNGNAKLEHLMEQQLELMTKATERDVALNTTLALLQQSMKTHEAREVEAWRDAFMLLRELRR